MTDESGSGTLAHAEPSGDDQDPGCGEMTEVYGTRQTAGSEII